MAPEILYNIGEEYTDVCDIYSVINILNNLSLESYFIDYATKEVFQENLQIKYH